MRYRRGRRGVFPSAWSGEVDKVRGDRRILFLFLFYIGLYDGTVPESGFGRVKLGSE
jgi:hypothetical protein